MITLLGDLPPHDSTAYANGKKLVQRAIGTLLREGAITLLSSGRRGHRARYKITLRFPQAVDNVHLLPAKGDTDVPLTGTQMSP